MEKSTFSAHYDAFRAMLRALRNSAGLTQRELARKLGREPSFVARIEQGERRVDVVELYWICHALKATPEKATSELLRQFKAIDLQKRLLRRHPTQPR